MADPNPKRAKMDNPNGQSGSTSPKDCKLQPDLIYTDSQSFDEIRNMPGFVDHTHFIQSFLQKKLPKRRGAKMAIFAPRRFGKSTHLNMVLQFLQIDVDKTTGEVSSCVNGPANGRKNYKLFEGTRIINDVNNETLVEDHLGKHPVIHLDFKNKSVNSFEGAEKNCRMAVHEAFKNHSYLETSTKLAPGNEARNAEDQNICKAWCSKVQYKKLDLDNSLVNLAEYLYNHFDGAKVYILVDEFDAINASALCRIPKENKVAKLIDICDIVGDLLGPVTKGCDLVAGALFTGVSYMSGLGYSRHFNNFSTMKFLDGNMEISGTDKEFVPFYGATKEEVESLIQKLVKNNELVNLKKKKQFLNDTNELDVKKIMDFVQSRYNGYFDVTGIRIFCLWSVLQYLQSGRAKHYWNETDGIRDLYKILKCEKVACEIIKLVRWKVIVFKRLREISIHDLVELVDLVAENGENEDKVDSEVVFNFLMDQGFLTYPEGGRQVQGEQFQGGEEEGEEEEGEEEEGEEEEGEEEEEDGKLEEFKLPNAEIRAALSIMIRDIVNKHWKIDTISCTALINNISLSLMKDKKALQNKMLHVYKAMSLILKQLKKTNSAHRNESRMICTMYTALNAAKSFALCVDLQIKDEEGESITLCRPDFLMLKRNEKFSILWELKYFNKKDKYTTSLYALQEARGLVPTKNAGKKNYMDAIKTLEREALVIGLSMDRDIKVSLSYAVGMEDKTMSLPLERNRNRRTDSVSFKVGKFKKLKISKLK